MIPLFDYNRHNLLMESSFRFEGYDFLYFDEGIPYYSLFRSSRKLNSFWELQYSAEVLIHLNPTLTYPIFKELIIELSDRSSGHIIRTYSEDRVTKMCDYIYNNRVSPYVRRYRKIVFNAGKLITNYEKLSIVGEIIGGQSRATKISPESIYEAVEELSLIKNKITYNKIGAFLNCTRQTISKHITTPIKDIIKYHNSHLSL